MLSAVSVWDKPIYGFILIHLSLRCCFVWNPPTLRVVCGFRRVNFFSIGLGWSFTIICRISLNTLAISDMSSKIFNISALEMAF